MKRNVRIIVLVVCLAMLMLTGCDIMQQAQNKVIEVALNGAVDGALDKAVDGNSEVAEVAGQIREKVTLKVVNSTISGNGVTATCLVTAPDMKDFIENFDANNYKDVQEICDAVIVAVNNAPMTRKEVTIGLTKTESGSFEPANVEELVAAYFGADDMDMVNDLLAQLK